MARLQPTDHELVRRIRDGDQAAFRLLVDRHGDALFTIARSMLGNTTDAEDVVQETFLGAFRRLAAFEGRSSVKTWLTRILLNHASKFRRSRRIRVMAPLHEDARVAGGHEERRSHATAVESRIDVTAMLQEVSPEHREILILRELQRLSYDEIAASLKIPRGTVESRLHRARHELRRQFPGYFA